jgi:hypothetical protein
MTIKSYINKVLKGNKQETIPKNINMIGDKYLNIAFESVGEKVLQLKKDKSLTKDEADIVLLAIERANKYGPLLDKTTDTDRKILDIRKILKDGRTPKNLRKAMDIILGSEKDSKKRDWYRIADDYGALTEDGEPGEAIKELVKRYKFPSEQALIRGLKRFKKRTGYPALKEALETLPWLDEPDE